jgi:hypothetical protein
MTVSIAFTTFHNSNVTKVLRAFRARTRSRRSSCEKIRWNALVVATTAGGYYMAARGRWTWWLTSRALAPRSCQRRIGAQSG